MFNADVPEEDIIGAIQRLDEKFQVEDFSFQLYKAAGGYQFLTKPAYQASIGIMLKQQSKKRLSTSAMETLSIIAYKQPISKTEIENIRGVNCDYAVQKLLDKSLIEITGKADTIGRPMLYGTTPKFMEYFGINDLNELPVPKEAASDVNTIGQNAESPDTMLVDGEGLIDFAGNVNDGELAGESLTIVAESEVSVVPSVALEDVVIPESEIEYQLPGNNTERADDEEEIESPDDLPEEPEKESDAQA